jgi:hypothetical protein
MRNTAAPGSLQGLHLVVADIDAARAELVKRGTDVSEVFHFASGGQQPGPDRQRSNYNSFLSFSDPDGNGWLVQEVRRTEPAARPGHRHLEARGTLVGLLPRTGS